MPGQPAPALKLQKTFLYSSEQPTATWGTLVVDSEPQPAPQPLLGSSQGSVNPKQAVAACGVFSVFCEVVTCQALEQEPNLH